jgi:hydroxymethylpyrimidine/phosphomethylpyrimidine kinase
MQDAVGQAIDYVQAAIKASANLKIGAGSGPLWHFYSEK